MLDFLVARDSSGDVIPCFFQHNEPLKIQKNFLTIPKNALPSLKMIKEPPAHNVHITLDPIFSGHICPYCGKPTVLTDSAEVYNGVSYGPIYICRPCNAFVGCHNGTTIALGRLADARLREAKKEAHSAFDRLWNKKANPSAPMTRHNAYSWLSKILGIDREYTHIGMFDVDTCKAVVTACEEFLHNQQ